MTIQAGVLEMTFARRGDRSVLAHLHRAAPLLVQQALYWDEHMPGLPCVYVITTSGCVLADDRFDISIALEAGAAAHITTQSATKIHKMETGFASQVQRIDLADNAYLELLPGPVIPQRHSRFDGMTDAIVTESATLLTAEILQPGRKHHGDGELFEYDRYSSVLTVRRPDGTSLFCEKFTAEPGRFPVRDAGAMGGFDVFANVTLVTPAVHTARILEQVSDGAGADAHPAGAGIMAGASLLPNDAGLVYKVLGIETQPVKAKIRAFWDLVRREVAGVPAPAIRPWE
ncbi:MAG TPA: urease accessory protein UreD [Streptosporangiaceae bacterium]|nr:urease accessory protein UreD [Streptosporangiaceae bacterium]